MNAGLVPSYRGGSEEILGNVVGTFLLLLLAVTASAVAQEVSPTKLAKIDAQIAEIQKTLPKYDHERKADVIRVAREDQSIVYVLKFRPNSADLKSIRKALSDIGQAGVNSAMYRFNPVSVCNGVLHFEMPIHLIYLDDEGTKVADVHVTVADCRARQQMGK